jgi:hypothetical protein
VARERRASAANGPAPDAAPQPDLFAPAGGVATTVAARERPAAAAPAGSVDKRALKGLVSELQALRAVMIDDKRR